MPSWTLLPSPSKHASPMSAGLSATAFAGRGPGEPALRERVEAVLQADVVDGYAREPAASGLLLGIPDARRAGPEQVDLPVQDSAAHATRVGLRVVSLLSKLARAPCRVRETEVG